MVDAADIDIDIDELAAAVVDRLDGGQRIGDKLVLSRRQAIALAGGGLSLAALGIGTGEVAAADGTADESVGAVGAPGDSIDVYLDQLLDDSGDEVLNVDDTGTANATARGWEFDSINIAKATIDQTLSFKSGSNWEAAETRGGRSVGVVEDDGVSTFLSGIEVYGFTGFVNVKRAAGHTSGLIGGRASDTGDGPQGFVIAQGGVDTIETTTSDVTGTTGTDGEVTVSVRDEVIEVENRAGTSAYIDIFLFGEE